MSFSQIASMGAFGGAPMKGAVGAAISGGAPMRGGFSAVPGTMDPTMLQAQMMGLPSATQVPGAGVSVQQLAQLQQSQAIRGVSAVPGFLASPQIQGGVASVPLAAMSSQQIIALQRAQAAAHAQQLQARAAAKANLSTEAFAKQALNLPAGTPLVPLDPVKLEALTPEMIAAKMKGRRSQYLRTACKADLLQIYSKTGKERNQSFENMVSTAIIQKEPPDGAPPRSDNDALNKLIMMMSGSKALAWKDTILGKLQATEDAKKPDDAEERGDSSSLRDFGDEDSDLVDGDTSSGGTKSGDDDSIISADPLGGDFLIKGKESTAAKKKEKKDAAKAAIRKKIELMENFPIKGESAPYSYPPASCKRFQNGNAVAFQALNTAMGKAVDEIYGASTPLLVRCRRPEDPHAKKTGGEKQYELEQQAIDALSRDEKSQSYKAWLWRMWSGPKVENTAVPSFFKKGPTSEPEPDFDATNINDDEYAELMRKTAKFRKRMDACLADSAKALTPGSCDKHASKYNDYKHKIEAVIDHRHKILTQSAVQFSRNKPLLPENLETRTSKMDPNYQRQLAKTYDGWIIPSEDWYNTSKNEVYVRKMVSEIPEGFFLTKEERAEMKAEWRVADEAEAAAKEATQTAQEAVMSEHIAKLPPALRTLAMRGLIQLGIAGVVPLSAAGGAAGLPGGLGGAAALAAGTPYGNALAKAYTFASSPEGSAAFQAAKNRDPAALKAAPNAAAMQNMNPEQFAQFQLAQTQAQTGLQVGQNLQAGGQKSVENLTAAGTREVGTMQQNIMMEMAKGKNAKEAAAAAAGKAMGNLNDVVFGEVINTRGGVMAGAGQLTAAGVQIRGAHLAGEATSGVSSPISGVSQVFGGPPVGRAAIGLLEVGRAKIPKTGDTMRIPKTSYAVGDGAVLAETKQVFAERNKATINPRDAIEIDEGEAKDYKKVPGAIVLPDSTVADKSAADEPGTDNAARGTRDNGEDVDPFLDPLKMTEEQVKKIKRTKERQLEKQMRQIEDYRRKQLGETPPNPAEGVQDTAKNEVEKAKTEKAEANEKAKKAKNSGSPEKAVKEEMKNEVEEVVAKKETEAGRELIPHPEKLITLKAKEAYPEFALIENAAYDVHRLPADCVGSGYIFEFWDPQRPPVPLRGNWPLLVTQINSPVSRPGSELDYNRFYTEWLRTYRRAVDIYKKETLGEYQTHTDRNEIPLRRLKSIEIVTEGGEEGHEKADYKGEISYSGLQEGSDGNKPTGPPKPKMLVRPKEKPKIAPPGSGEYREGFEPGGERKAPEQTSELAISKTKIAETSVSEKSVTKTSLADTVEPDGKEEADTREVDTKKVDTKEADAKGGDAKAGVAKKGEKSKPKVKWPCMLGEYVTKCDPRNGWRCGFVHNTFQKTAPCSIYTGDEMNCVANPHCSFADGKCNTRCSFLFSEIECGTVGAETCTYDPVNKKCRQKCEVYTPDTCPSLYCVKDQDSGNCVKRCTGFNRFNDRHNCPVSKPDPADETGEKEVPDRCEYFDSANIDPYAQAKVVRVGGKRPTAEVDVANNSAALNIPMSSCETRCELSIPPVETHSKNELSAMCRKNRPMCAYMDDKCTKACKFRSVQIGSLAKAVPGSVDTAATECTGRSAGCRVEGLKCADNCESHLTKQQCIGTNRECFWNAQANICLQSCSQHKDQKMCEAQVLPAKEKVLHPPEAERSSPKSEADSNPDGSHNTDQSPEERAKADKAKPEKAKATENQPVHFCHWNLDEKSCRRRCDQYGDENSCEVYGENLCQWSTGIQKCRQRCETYPANPRMQSARRQRGMSDEIKMKQCNSGRFRVIPDYRVGDTVQLIEMPVDIEKDEETAIDERDAIAAAADASVVQAGRDAFARAKRDAAAQAIKNFNFQRPAYRGRFLEIFRKEGVNGPGMPGGVKTPILPGHKRSIHTEIGHYSLPKKSAFQAPAQRGTPLVDPSNPMKDQKNPAPSEPLPHVKLTAVDRAKQTVTYMMLEAPKEGVIPRESADLKKPITISFDKIRPLGEDAYEEFPSSPNPEIADSHCAWNPVVGLCEMHQSQMSWREKLRSQYGSLWGPKILSKLLKVNAGDMDGLTKNIQKLNKDEFRPRGIPMSEKEIQGIEEFAKRIYDARIRKLPVDEEWVEESLSKTTTAAADEDNIAANVIKQERKKKKRPVEEDKKEPPLPVDREFLMANGGKSSCEFQFKENSDPKKSKWILRPSPTRDFMYFHHSRRGTVFPFQLPKPEEQDDEDAGSHADSQASILGKAKKYFSDVGKGFGNVGRPWQKSGLNEIGRELVDPSKETHAGSSKTTHARASALMEIFSEPANATLSRAKLFTTDSDLSANSKDLLHKKLRKFVLETPDGQLEDAVKAFAREMVKRHGKIKGMVKVVSSFQSFADALAEEQQEEAEQYRKRAELQDEIKQKEAEKAKKAAEIGPLGKELQKQGVDPNVLKKGGRLDGLKAIMNFYPTALNPSQLPAWVAKTLPLDELMQKPGIWRPNKKYLEFLPSMKGETDPSNVKGAGESNVGTPPGDVASPSKPRGERIIIKPHFLEGPGFKRRSCDLDGNLKRNDYHKFVKCAKYKLHIAVLREFARRTEFDGSGILEKPETAACVEDMAKLVANPPGRTRDMVDLVFGTFGMKGDMTAAMQDGMKEELTWIDPFFNFLGNVILGIGPGFMDLMAAINLGYENKEA